MFKVIVVLTVDSATIGTAMNHERAAMARAIDLAQRRQGRTHPNPPVGALVITPGGRCVGTGSTQTAGNAHAETVALVEAGARARGATLVVTLEPCNHAGRTPPCTETIVRAGINRIIIGSRDMNPEVRGGGIEYLFGIAMIGKMKSLRLKILLIAMNATQHHWFKMMMF